MAEIEHFCDPADKRHPRFSTVADVAEVRPRPTRVRRVIAQTMSTALALVARVRQANVTLGTVVFCATR